MFWLRITTDSYYFLVFKCFIVFIQQQKKIELIKDMYTKQWKKNINKLLKIALKILNYLTFFVESNLIDLYIYIDKL